MHVTGNDLKKMRRISGHTTVEMSKLAGVKTRKTYENWEKDIGTPNVNQFFAMATGCGLEVQTVKEWFDRAMGNL